MVYETRRENGLSLKRMRTKVEINVRCVMPLMDFSADNNPPISEFIIDVTFPVLIPPAASICVERQRPCSFTPPSDAVGIDDAGTIPSLHPSTFGLSSSISYRFPRL